MSETLSYDAYEGRIAGLTEDHAGLMHFMAMNAFWLDRNDIIKTHTPGGFAVDLKSHSTGTHLKFHAVHPGRPSLLVWYGTHWNDRRNNCNEKDAIVGVQPGCDFALPIVSAFITVLFRAKAEKDNHERTVKEIAEAARRTEEAGTLEFYRQRTESGEIVKSKVGTE